MTHPFHQIIAKNQPIPEILFLSDLIVEEETSTIFGQTRWISVGRVDHVTLEPIQ